MRKELLWIFLTIPLILGVLSISTMKANATEVHDITVVSVTPSPTSVEFGDPVNITVVVENQGNTSETFNVTTYYDNTVIQTKNVTDLAAGNQTTLTFNWNTTGLTFPYSGNFEINATASTVSGETNTEDNTLVSLSRVRVFKSPYIAVDPHSTVNPNLTIGTSYTVSIKTDYNGSDITVYQFTLTYNPNVLHGVKVTNGDLIINTTQYPYEAVFLPGTFNNTAGKLSLTVAYFFATEYPVPLTSGPGTLANVTFTVVGTGDSDITLGTDIVDSTSLFGYTEEGYGAEYTIIDQQTPELGHILHGYFRNTLAEVIHDVAVISVKPNSTSVEEGELVDITVVVENQGTVTETFAVKANRREEGGETWLIDTKTASSLAASANTSLTFTWNTTGVRPANHIISAVASTVSGETDTRDNTRESEDIITVRAKPEQPIPLELIIGIGVAVVVVIAVIVFALRRGRKTPE